MKKKLLAISFLALISYWTCAQQQSAPKKKGIKTYTNSQFGISFDYPSKATITEKKMPIRPDLNNYDPGYFINVNVPFIKHYGVWTSKTVDISIHDGGCNDFLGSWKLQQKTINGITYTYYDPDWTETTGMSSMSKQRNYYYELSNKCYIISEYISGLGNNERPSNATAPSDVNSFLNSELIALDKIVATLTIK